MPSPNPSPVIQSKQIPFLPRDTMHSADYAVARCASVRLSVWLSHTGILSKRRYISSNHRVATPL